MTCEERFDILNRLVVDGVKERQTDRRTDRMAFSNNTI